jgi:CDP-6-deoxy-D-xylo-4-hexulose-3-dehydrase|tara:strand:+ start:4187 stop:5365 length:1179 start_codon:yes stop_codon:yes gene_type:complete
MKYPLACDTWDKRELDAIQEVIKSGRYTMGPHVKKFEQEFCDYFKCKDAVMVNSGSTANLLMLAVLKLKYGLKGNIIVPAVSWSTTFFPLQQYGFKLNFVDIDPGTLNIDIMRVEEAINKDTSAIFAVNLLGNSCDFKELKRIAEKHNLMLIEDNCESLGAINTDLDAYTGTIGQMGSFSFFFSHHLQTMEGGMIACKDKDDADYLRSLRAHGWCRDLPDDNKIYKKTGDKFKDSFTFVTLGYSVRPLEMSGAIGSVQLKKWPKMREQRIKNAEYFKEKFKDMDLGQGGEGNVLLQQEIGKSSWFGFSLICIKKLMYRRDEVVKKLTEAGVECRPIVAGNFMRNPVIKFIPYFNISWQNAELIHNNGLFIGNDIRDLKENIDMVYNIIKEIE